MYIDYDGHEVSKHIYEIDLHGLNMADAKMVLDEVFDYIRYEEHIQELHIVVGQGRGSETGPVLPSYVGNYLHNRGLKFQTKHGVIHTKVRMIH